VFQFVLWAIWATLRPKALLIAENLCLREQLAVLQRRHARPQLNHTERLFWILASRYLGFARHAPRCEARNGTDMAPTGLAGLLAMAITTWSNGIAKASVSTGGGDHVVPDGPRRMVKSVPLSVR